MFICVHLWFHCSSVRDLTFQVTSPKCTAGRRGSAREAATSSAEPNRETITAGPSPASQTSREFGSFPRSLDAAGTGVRTP